MGNENCLPMVRVNPNSTRNRPPTIKMAVWYSRSIIVRAVAPKPIGINTARSPRKYIKVIKKTVHFSLKIEAKYVGSNTVIQQGAKRAAMPAKYAATSDALTRRSISGRVAAGV